MSLHEELLSQQQESINSFMRSLEEEISLNSQQVQRLIEQQSVSNLPKSIVGQVEALMAKEENRMPPHYKFWRKSIKRPLRLQKNSTTG